MSRGRVMRRTVAAYAEEAADDIRHHGYAPGHHPPLYAAYKAMLQVLDRRLPRLSTKARSIRAARTRCLLRIALAQTIYDGLFEPKPVLPTIYDLLPPVLPRMFYYRQIRTALRRANRKLRRSPT